jgi:hypothetical protein
MLYLWGPGLDAELEYRRTELGKSAGKSGHWWRRVRSTVSTMGRDRPRPW